MLCRSELEGLGPGGRLDDIEARSPEVERADESHRRVILDEQHRKRRLRRSTRIVVGCDEMASADRRGLPGVLLLSRKEKRRRNREHGWNLARKPQARIPGGLRIGA